MSDWVREGNSLFSRGGASNWRFELHRVVPTTALAAELNDVGYWYLTKSRKDGGFTLLGKYVPAIPTPPLEWANRLVLQNAMENL